MPTIFYFTFWQKTKLDLQHILWQIYNWYTRESIYSKNKTLQYVSLSAANQTAVFSVCVIKYVRLVPVENGL
jgi:hypothetical protein